MDTRRNPGEPGKLELLLLERGFRRDLDLDHAIDRWSSTALVPPVHDNPCRWILFCGSFRKQGHICSACILSMCVCPSQ